MPPSPGIPRSHDFRKRRRRLAGASLQELLAGCSAPQTLRQAPNVCKQEVYSSPDHAVHCTHNLFQIMKVTLLGVQCTQQFKFVYLQIQPLLSLESHRYYSYIARCMPSCSNGAACDIHQRTPSAAAGSRVHSSLSSMLCRPSRFSPW